MLSLYCAALAQQAVCSFRRHTDGRADFQVPSALQEGVVP